MGPRDISETRSARRGPKRPGVRPVGSRHDRPCHSPCRLAGQRGTSGKDVPRHVSRPICRHDRIPGVQRDAHETLSVTNGIPLPGAPQRVPEETRPCTDHADTKGFGGNGSVASCIARKAKRHFLPNRSGHTLPGRIGMPSADEISLPIDSQPYRQPRLMATRMRGCPTERTLSCAAIREATLRTTRRR